MCHKAGMDSSCIKVVVAVAAAAAVAAVVLVLDEGVVEAELLVGVALLRVLGGHQQALQELQLSQLGPEAAASVLQGGRERDSRMTLMATTTCVRDARPDIFALDTSSLKYLRARRFGVATGQLCLAGPSLPARGRWGKVSGRASPPTSPRQGRNRRGPPSSSSPRAS